MLDARDGIADGSAHCPTVRVMNNVPDQAALAQVFADPNCFSFQETIPGGFTPQFGGVVSDRSVVAGVRRLAANGLTWDASASYGAHESDFFFNNTVNASLGPDTPRNFDPGLYRQEEVNLNFDVSYAAIDIVNIAGGAEWRDERFDIGAGGRPSWEVGPYAAQGFVSGSNGFPGFPAYTAGTWNRSNVALYGDLELRDGPPTLSPCVSLWPPPPARRSNRAYRPGPRPLCPESRRPPRPPTCTRRHLFRPAYASIPASVVGKLVDDHGRFCEVCGTLEYARTIPPKNTPAYHVDDDPAVRDSLRRVGAL